jgi:hypothetical protein
MRDVSLQVVDREFGNRAASTVVMTIADAPQSLTMPNQRIAALLTIFSFS